MISHSFRKPSSIASALVRRAAYQAAGRMKVVELIERISGVHHRVLYWIGFVRRDLGSGTRGWGRLALLDGVEFGAGFEAVTMVAYSPMKAANRQWFNLPAFITTTLAALFVIYLVTVVLFPNVPKYIGPSNTIYTSHPDVASIQQDFSPHVRKLITDLKQATEDAEQGGQPFSFSASDRKRWHREFPCRARTELPPLYAGRRVKDVDPNPQWEAVLAEYTNLHRTCINRIGNLTDFYYNKQTLPGCKFITGESLFGLGNKISFAASLVLYAVLTQRIVLFPKWTSSMPLTMCEPFEGSSWVLPLELESLVKRRISPETSVYELKTTNVTRKFLNWVDREEKHSPDGSDRKLDGKIYYGEMDNGWLPVERFWCDTEQEFASHVTWMSMAGCFYFLPKLFAVSSFRPTLEELFPDKMASTHVLRTVFLPGNAAWDRIKRVDDMFFEKADRRVGIQARYLNGEMEHLQLSKQVNKHITQCLLENFILPNVSEVFSNKLVEKAPNPPPIIKVVIASLFMDLHDHLSVMYLRNQTVTGESVGLLQLTHDFEQKWGMEPDTQALVEIILLSLSDTILVTPRSTFGGVAQAYGGLRPYIIQHSGEEVGSCVRSDSADMCFQEVATNFTCPYDESLHGKQVSDVVPYIQKCMTVDSVNGLHLITSGR
ncbi:hypothetical protein R1sor_000509 [Riccia sorocarpa]|uniref:Fucosyltransferase n=1 Tax=Riccia sorocarpa TaxID=122646 RepID=A0ABD3GTB2_9MARC